jgi:RNA recognition motif-containing protein
MKNTFLCFKCSSGFPNQSLRQRSFTDTALLIESGDSDRDCEPRSWNSETLAGSIGESESRSASPDSLVGAERHEDTILLRSSAIPAETEVAEDLSRRHSAFMRHQHAQPDDYTTVMLRNLPNNYTRDMLIELLDAKGFKQRFDFVYLPIDFEKGSGLGYAFVNFVTNEDALRAMHTLEEFDDWIVPSQKVLHTSWSLPLQGLTANVERYRNSAVMHPDVPQHLKPLILENGSSVEFPAPTRNITLTIRSTGIDARLGKASPTLQPQAKSERPKEKLNKKHQRNFTCDETFSEKYTTVMLRNVPNNYTRAMLLDLLDSKSFRRRFDFLYLPIDFARKCGLGYAFVNFVTHEDAKHAMQLLDRFDDWKVPSQKSLQLSWSVPLQGLTANIERYRNNSVMHSDVPEQFKPLLLKDGETICFPSPSRNIHPPHRRR